jgi:Isochorismatase family
MDRLDPARDGSGGSAYGQGRGRGCRHPLQSIVPPAGREGGAYRDPAAIAGQVPRGRGEGGLHLGRVPAGAPRGHAELPAVRHPHRQSHPAAEHPRDRGHGRSRPQPKDPVIRGQGASGFEGTSLDIILRVAGVDNLVLVGIATDVAVESTARAACDLAYRPIVVSDGCLTDTDEGHANSLAVIKKWFGETPTADEVLSALKQAVRAERRRNPVGNESAAKETLRAARRLRSPPRRRPEVRLAARGRWVAGHRTRSG